MVFLKTKSKYDKSTCHKEGCDKSWIKDAEYIYDTDGKKAYCLNHDEINSKVTQNKPFQKGGGGWQKPVQQLWRTPEEAIAAIDIWHGGVIPKILETCKKLGPKDSEIADATKFGQVAELYAEIFLGKFKGKTTS